MQHMWSLNDYLVHIIDIILSLEPRVSYVFGELIVYFSKTIGLLMSPTKIYFTIYMSVK